MLLIYDNMESKKNISDKTGKNLSLPEIKKKIIEQIKLQDPKEYEWLGGKPLGRIYQKGDAFIVEMSDPKERVLHKKAFPFVRYKGEEKAAKKAAYNWSVYYSQKCQAAMNCYKIVDDKYLLIRLNDNMVTLINLRCINMIHMVDLTAVLTPTQSVKNHQVYQVYCIKEHINSPFHHIATGKPTATHISRYTLDNRNDNFREEKLEFDLSRTHQGIKLHQTRNGNSWKGRVKVNNKDNSIIYSADTYGYDQAKLLTIQWRRNVENKSDNAPEDLENIKDLADDFTGLMKKYSESGLLDDLIYDPEKEKPTINQNTSDYAVKEHLDNDDETPQMDSSFKPDLEDPVMICSYLLQYFDGL
jgi:hypothetical protein